MPFLPKFTGHQNRFLSIFLNFDNKFKNVDAKNTNDYLKIKSGFQINCKKNLEKNFEMNKMIEKMKTKYDKEKNK